MYLIDILHRFGIEKTKTLMDFFIIMRTNIGIDKNTSLFIYCNNTIIMNQGILLYYDM